MGIRRQAVIHSVKGSCTRGELLALLLPLPCGQFTLLMAAWQPFTPLDGASLACARGAEGFLVKSTPLRLHAYFGILHWRGGPLDGVRWDSASRGRGMTCGWVVAKPVESTHMPLRYTEKLW
jgi:hypothetical protein